MVPTTQRQTAARVRVTPPVALVVDDDPLVTRALSRQLRDTFDVIVAYGVAHGMAFALHVPRIDLTIVDHDLPDGIGPTLLAAVKAAHPGAARVLVSGRNRDSLAALNQLHAHLFLQKPLSPLWIQCIRESVLRTRHLNR